ncbi:ParB/RepB/Spo0J family partition protein [Kitasatospora sp. NPDC052868]|uniref:ParB/RepB/Spo0J family partition protein n=1 Tax=Kitasatospora sp. NPDC052868 TaxID=3364060 RepID=UPI0037CBB4C5
MGKQVSFASMADDPVEPVPGVDPSNRVDAGPARWIPTENCRYNPRNPRDLGDLSNLDSIDVSDLASIAEKQLQSCLAVTLQAYLKLWPEDEDDLDLTSRDDVIVINGNRRLAAANKYGQPRLIVVVDDSHAASKAKLLRAALDENMSRKDFDPIEEARGVMLLVAEYPTAKDAAEGEGWSGPWISQRKNLLKLHPDLQELVRSKARGGEGIAIRHARAVAQTKGIEDMPAAQQMVLLNQLLELEAEAALKKKMDRQEAKAERKRLAASGPGTAPRAHPRPDERSLAEGANSGPGGFSMENPPPREVDGAGPMESTGSAEVDPGTGSPTGGDPVVVGHDGFSMENPSEVPSPREADARLEHGSDEPVSDGTRSTGASIPDWRDLDGVAAWLVRYLQPAEARTVAHAVLDKVGLIEQPPVV